MTAQLQLTFGGYSSAGQKSENQDAFAAWQPTAGQVRYKGIGCCIADGVSCSENAQQASATSVTHFLNDYYSTPDSWDVKTAAGKVLSALNSWLYHQGQQASAQHNALVTTFSGLIFKSNTFHLFHAGDSRVYRLRNGTFECLTRDHTQRVGKDKEYLSRALGMDTRLEVDYISDELAAGDVFLCTTDGVHGYLVDKALQGLLTETLPQWSEGADNASIQQTQLERCAEALVNQALANGSDDNLTALIINITQVPEKSIEETHKQLTARMIPPVLEIGQRIDQCEVEKVIYSGTRSHLYRVKNQRDGKRYVLKAPSLNFEEDLVYLEGFIREQWIGSRIDHPNIMRIEPPLEGGRFLYHLCEYIDGQSLRQWMDDHPSPSLKDVREIIEQVIHGLRALQRQGMVHRDIKPENVMLTPEGGIKIIDFGTMYVKGLAEVGSAVEEDIPVGSVNYIAPEYVVDGVADYRADLFSTGVMVYEMLCGEQPFQMEKVQRRGAKSINEWHYQSIREHRQDIPKWLDLALETACHPDMTERHQAYSEFWQDICRPNPTLMRRFEEKPLLERAGVNFWKAAALTLGALAVVEGLMLVYLSTRS